MFNHVMSDVEAERTVQESMSTVERIIKVVVVDVFLQRTQPSSEDES